MPFLCCRPCLCRFGNRLRAAALVLVFVFVGITLHPAVTSNESVKFRDGDRWAVIGDSITHTGTYHAWVHLYYLTRFPNRSLQVINCGIAGDTAAGGLRRLSWDIIPRQATIATVSFGMNDVGRGLYAVDPPTAEQRANRQRAISILLENEKALVGKLRQNGLRVILLSPSIFDDEVDLPTPALHGVNAALAQCTQEFAALARELNCGFIDLHEPMLALNRTLQAQDRTFTLTGSDRIHPGGEGHFIMAYYFLKAQSSPREVATLSLDAKNLFVLRATNGRIEKLRRTGGALSFVWTEAALPFPIEPSLARAASWVSFTEDLNQEILKITGLPTGTYLLRIDETSIRPVTAEEFSQGLNLALETKTPQYQQALAVAKVVQDYAHQSAETLRNLALVEHQTTPGNLLPASLSVVRPFVDLKFASFAENIPSPNLLRIYNLYAQEKPREEASRSRIVQLEEQAGILAQPHPHRYEIVAVPSTAPFAPP